MRISAAVCSAAFFLPRKEYLMSSNADQIQQLSGCREHELSTEVLKQRRQTWGNRITAESPRWRDGHDEGIQMKEKTQDETSQPGDEDGNNTRTLNGTKWVCAGRSQRGHPAGGENILRVFRPKRSGRLLGSQYLRRAIALEAMKRMNAKGKGSRNERPSMKLQGCRLCP